MTTAGFELRTDSELTGETVMLGKSASGLTLRIAPTERFREISAMVTFGYGSTDLGFERADGAVHRSPEGVAHYLEHKLFEDEDLHVFQRFGARGAQVNAMTGFGRTTYYFNAVDKLEQNLSDLLRLVSRAHLTQENVDKERGIIAQELRMYEDSPEYRGFFDLLGCLYAEHPVRSPVGGTVESIEAIDVAELDACYGAFYRSGNAALSVAGPVDPTEVLAIADRCALAAGAAPRSHCPEDLGAPGQRRSERVMDVVRPRVLVGFKERSLVLDATQRVRRDLASRMLLDRMFGGTSAARESLQERGVVDDSLHGSYSSEARFGFAVAGCETEEPERVIEAIRELMLTPVSIDAADLERSRRMMLGQAVRSFESVQRVAMAHGEEGLVGLEPFGALERMRALTVDDVLQRQEELCRDDAFAAAIVRR